MLWQVATAFGIMIGNAVSLMFFKVPDSGGIDGLAWRLMMGSPALVALLICCFAPFCPDSPRWLMSKGRHAEAYRAMLCFRSSKEKAVRDLVQAYLMEFAITPAIKPSAIKTIKSLTEARNRRALYASEMVMFMQQFSGVNVIAYCKFDDLRLPCAAS